MRHLTNLLAASLVLASSLHAQDSKPTPDILLFANGDQLTGHLERAAGGNIVFKSDMAGEITVGFDKVKELRSGTDAAQFALLRKGIKVNKHTPAPEGTVSIADGTVLVATDKPAANPDSSATPASVPAAQVDLLVDKGEFDKQVAGTHSFRDGWNGSVTGGATLVRSTQTGTTLTAALNLIRALPTVAWLPARNRTTLNVNESYGKLSTPVIPPTVPPTAPTVVLTSIFHADAERDEYFTPRFFALADTAFDHNYSQGLSLQQVYGGGIGWTVLKSPKQQLDLKADVHYEKQQYIQPLPTIPPTPPTPSNNLIGSTIFESYHRNLPRRMVFTESLNILPAFNQPKDYSANASAILAIPVFKRLSASVTTADNFLNDPAQYYKKNSYQFVTGVTYTLH